MKIKDYNYYSISWLPNQKFIDYCKVHHLSANVSLEKHIHTDVRKQDLQIFQSRRIENLL